MYIHVHMYFTYVINIHIHVMCKIQFMTTYVYLSSPPPPPPSLLCPKFDFYAFPLPLLGCSDCQALTNQVLLIYFYGISMAIKNGKLIEVYMCAYIVAACAYIS